MHGPLRETDEHGPLTIENAENHHKLHWFIVSLYGKGTQFRAKDYDELREFTAKDLELKNTDYLLIYRAPQTELMIKN